MLEFSVAASEMVVESSAAADAGGLIHGGASIGVSVVDVSPVDGCWARWLLEDLLAQHPSLLGRHFEQGFPAFTQAHLLQEPVLLRLQHANTCN